MPKAGMLIQMDGSQHRWLPFIDKPWYLIATVDDATSKVFLLKSTLMKEYLPVWK
jgi:hypothetical protein